jgi:hypothetical protein
MTTTSTTLPTGVGGAALDTFQFTAASGWSCGELPDLDSERTLAVVFGAPEFADRPAVFAELAARYPRSCVLGCSTAGEILGGALHDHSLAVAVLRFAHTPLRRVSLPITQATSRGTGEALADGLLAPDLKAVFVLAEGLDVNGSELVRGLNDRLPSHVVVTGGLAADGDRFQRTWVLDRGAPARGRVCAVGFYGDAVRVGHGSKGGWDTFGPERLITRAQGNVLFELDGKPALHTYKEYLGERAKGLPATALLFPLALRAPGATDKLIVRTVLAVDEASQSMTFAGDLPVGHSARFMRANFDRIVDGATEASRLSNQADVAGPLLAIAVSCVGRRLVLGERTEDEIEAALSALPAATRQIGYYSYGEVSPFAHGHCDLHNQTMTLTTFAER